MSMSATTMLPMKIEIAFSLNLNLNLQIIKSAHVMKESRDLLQIALSNSAMQ